MCIKSSSTGRGFKEPDCVELCFEASPNPLPERGLSDPVFVDLSFDIAFIY
jgi:hypothetical protein